MSERDETLEERVRRLEAQKVRPEEERRKSPEEAEERLETPEDPPAPAPPGRG